MAKMDMYNNIELDIAVANKIYADGMDQNGSNIDMQGYESLVFEIQAGVLATAGDTDGTYAFIMQEADEDPSNPGTPDTYDEVDANYIQGSMPTIDGTDADERDAVYWVGYIGEKRFVRLQFDASAITNGMPLGAIAIKGHPHSAPVE